MPNKYYPAPANTGAHKDLAKAIENQLTGLGLENGGLFKNTKRTMTPGDVVTGTPEQRALFISYGGTGADALYALKLRLKEDLIEDDYKKKIQFLAVDSASTTQFVPGQDPKNINAEKRFTDTEFMWLNNSDARALVNKPEVDCWINQELKHTILSDMSYLDGSGASNTRQIGRVLMLANAKTMHDRVANIAAKLTEGTHCQLDVFIITGVSGGTGSGIVIDASYIIQQAVMTSVKGNANIVGMILLPPTGTSTNPMQISKGNANGYAALKEIEHFMTLNRREGDIYEQSFGPSFSISTKNKIFNNCFLFDGNLTKVALVEPRARAIEAMCDSILDMITIMPVADQTIVMPVAEIMADQTPRARNFVEKTDPSVAPRDGNYIYLTMGYGKTVVPSKLIKAYVANEVFTTMYNVFRHAENANSAQASDFVDEILVPLKEYTQSVQDAKIRQSISRRFTNFINVQGGPYYVINLLNLAAQECQRRINECNSKVLELHKGEKVEQLTFCQDRMLYYNNALFSIFTVVMENLKNYLIRESDILVHTKNDGNSYEFFPLEFSVMDEGSTAVIRFLDSMFDGNAKAQIAQHFTSELLSKADQWMASTNMNAARTMRFNAAEEVRAFWDSEISKAVDAQIENYLIKYYSKKPEISYQEILNPETNELQPTPEVDKALGLAASRIGAEMFGIAGRCLPRLAQNANLSAQYSKTINSITYFLIPKNCPHLKVYLQNFIDHQYPNVKVIDSTSNDTISSFNITTGIPSFLSAWAKTAESNYEEEVANGAMGLHMTQTAQGENWSRFSNLLPENIWTEVGTEAYYNSREKRIADDARDLFFRAKDLGLAYAVRLPETNFVYYKLKLLPQQKRPELELFRAIEYAVEGSADQKNCEVNLDNRCTELSEQLYGDGSGWDTIETKDSFAFVYDKKYAGQADSNLKEVSLAFDETVLVYPKNALELPKDGWCEELAADLLRTWPDLVEELRGTLMVIDKLYARVSKEQTKDARMLNFAKYVALGLIRYDEPNMYWIYNSNKGGVILFEMEYGNQLQQDTVYYELFKKYFERADEVDADLHDELLEVTNVHYLEKGAATIAKQKELVEKAQALVAKIGDKANPRKTPFLTPDFKKKYKNAMDIFDIYEKLAEAANKPMHVDETID